MNKDIAILLPYKEKFNINKAGAAAIWVKDYLTSSKLKSRTIVYGNLDNKDKPLLSNFRNINLNKIYIKKTISYTAKLYEEYLKNKSIKFYLKIIRLVLKKMKIDCQYLMFYHQVFLENN